MNLYAVLENKKQDANNSAYLVADKFRMPALLFPVTWLMAKRLWLMAFLITLARFLVIALNLDGIISIETNIILQIIIHWLVSVEGSQWQKNKLIRTEFYELGTISANNSEDAEYQYLLAVSK